MLSAYLAAAAVLALLAAIPGPDVAVVSRYALSGGWAPASRTAVGVVIGLAAWGAATAIGLAVLFAASATAFTLVRLAGAAYLLTLGVITLRRSAAVADAAASYPARAG